MNWGKHIGLVVAGSAALFVVGCKDQINYDQFARTNAPYDQQWSHDRDQAKWDADHAGYSGAFACHTADGGCLHMTCSNKLSCDYMADAEKRCAVPSVREKVTVIEDDYCKSTEAATTYPPANTAVTSTGTVYVTSNGSGWTASTSNGGN